MPIESIKGTTGLSLVHQSHHLGDTVRAVQKFSGPYSACVAGAKPKGAWGTGEFAGYVVENSMPGHNGDVADGTLVINWAWSPTSGIPLNGTAGADLPETTHGCRQEEKDIAVENLGAYADVADATVTVEGVSRKLLSVMRSAFGNPEEYEPILADALTSVSPELFASASELYGLWLTGNTHKRFWVPIYWLKTYSWTAPLLDPGGYCLATPVGPETASLSPGMDWLRVPDAREYTGGCWRKDSEYIGLPATSDNGGPGGWNPILYPHP